MSSVSLDRVFEPRSLWLYIAAAVAFGRLIAEKIHARLAVNAAL